MGIWLLIAVVVAVLDQATKLVADSVLSYHSPVPVIPFFNLTLSYNPGAAFSFLGDASGWQRWFFIALATGVSVFLIQWLRQLQGKDRWLSASLSLILGGAVGNLIDRVAYGHVVDFIHFYIGDWSWPIFNVADIAITVGAGLLIAHMFLVKQSPQEQER
nr:signal peptidase II [Alkalilimnicola ehrlichii]